MVLFPFSEYWPLYAGFSLFVFVMVALDLGVFHKKAHEVSVREGSIWTVVWVALAGVFNLGFYLFVRSTFPQSPEIAKLLALEFLSGFIVEKSLAIDNIFVFAIVFSYFRIPKLKQHRILFLGIIGALIFRAIFIAIGSQLMAYKAVIVIFGVLLILTGIKMLIAADKMIEPERSWLLRGLAKLVPVDFSEDSEKLFVRKNGVLHATPIFMALIFLEVTDLLFAIDSVPAIFALTKEPFIVFTSNIFAILGLRSMYFMLAGVIDRFRYIKHGLASILIFVGLKMAWLNEAFGGKFPISWSLGIIAALLSSSIFYSWLRNNAKQSEPVKR